MLQTDPRPPQAGDEPATSAALLTPWGRGAVAVVQVRGPRALDAVRHYFLPARGKLFDRMQMDRIVFGHWRDLAGEEVVVTVRSADGPSAVVEIHGHGGLMAPQAILDDLRLAGCTTVMWQQAVQATGTDPISIAAQIALADARTTRTAAILLDQYRGALAAAFSNVEQLLGASLSGAGQASGIPNEAALQLAQKKLTRLRELVPLGRHLTTPWQVVLAGKPNVGKSSLMNRLLGYERSIVFHRPGTTRDVLEATTALDGWPVRLIDCAGLGETADPIEREGVSRARQALAAADLVLVVIDGREAISSEELQLLATHPRAMLVANKSDLIIAHTTISRQLPTAAPSVATSATTGQGIECLVETIVNLLVPSPPQLGEAVPFAEEHIERVDRFLAAVPF